MRRGNVVGLACWLATAAMLSAATEIWDKPYNTWTDVELKQMITSSPWAGKGGISRVTQKGAEAGTVDDAAMVVWYSALPMRHASVRQQIKAGATVPAELEASISQAFPNYTVGVKITDGPNSASFARAANVSQAETFLLRDGKPPIAAIQAEGRVLDKDGKPVETPAGPPAGGGSGAPRGGAPANGPLLSMQGGGRGGGGGGRGFGGQGGSSLMLFSFPKTDAITLADKEVEFVTKLCSQSFGRGAPGAPGGQGGGSNCQYNVKKKFKLKDMVIKGELAL